MFNIYKLPGFLRSIDASSSKLFPLSIISLFVFSLIILLRYPPFLLEPRFYAEETIYFETFHSVINWWEGFDALLYPSYYVGLSRVGGFLASLVEIQNAPLVTTLFGFFVLLIPMLIIFLTNCKYWENLEQKIVLSLFLIFSCSTGEIWLNSNNLGFIVPIVTFLILLDDNLESRLKRFTYSAYLCFGVLTGPYVLLMSPFFLLRYLRHKEKQVLYYCLIFLAFGSLQVLYFFVSFNIGLGSANRFGGGITIGIVERLIYLIQFNLIFPLFGYFISFIFRIFFDLINTGFENVRYLPGILEMIPTNLENIFAIVLSFLAKIHEIVNVLVISMISLFFYFQYKTSDLDEKLNFLSLYIWLSLTISFLSLGGHGGFRYSYPTGFILLFFLYQKFHASKGKKFSRKLTTTIIVFSILIGIFEYYPRVLSSSPSVASNSTPYIEWPNWKEEVSKWENDNDYKPIVWPYLKERDLLFPKKVHIHDLSLDTPEKWEAAGKKRFTSTLVNLLSEESIDKDSHQNNTNSN